MKCYYKILGISHRASEEEIKKAFRMLAMRWHPDRNPHESHAAQNFRKALDAYEVLINPSTRKQYDKLRGYNKSRRNAPHQPLERGEGKSDSFTEVFQGAFGIEWGEKKECREKDLRFDLQISKSAAACGMFEEIFFQRLVFCNECFGNGRKVPLASCQECKGTGEREEMCSLRIWIPPGSEEGTRIRIRGVGDREIPGRAAGDLIVVIYVI
ncbi:DnaJ domain-containing protein [Desulforhabdus amnigena]|nr:DnaJ domain-containing protein [Desulforhabdus amnigena]